MAVKVIGYRETLRAINKFSPDLQRDAKKEINRAAGEAVKLARGYVPEDPGMSGWDKINYEPGQRWYDRAYAAGEIKRGIRVYRGRLRQGVSRGWYVGIGAENRSAAGMIYELAGSKSDGIKPQGPSFIRNIASTGLRTPLRRVIVRAGVEIGPQVTDKIMAAFRRIERRTNRVTS